MKLSQEQIESILEEVKPSLINGVKQDFLSQVMPNVRHALTDEILKFTKDWVKENIIPEVEKELIESKDSFIKLGISTSETIMETLAKELSRAVSENLSNSWRRKEIFSKLFD